MFFYIENIFDNQKPHKIFSWILIYESLCKHMSRLLIKHSRAWNLKCSLWILSSFSPGILQKLNLIEGTEKVKFKRYIWYDCIGPDIPHIFILRTSMRKAKIFSSILGSQNCLVLLNSPSSRVIMIENNLLKFDMSRSLFRQIFFQILFLILNVKIVTWQHPSPPRQRRGRVERTPSTTNISREIFPAEHQLFG